MLAPSIRWQLVTRRRIANERAASLLHDFV